MIVALNTYRASTRLASVVLTAVCAFGVAACGGAPAEPGVDYEGDRLEVFDMHLHTGTWAKMPPWFQERLAERVPRGFKWLVAILSDRWLAGEGILSELDKAGISGGGVFALYSPHTTGIATNEFVLTQLESDPRRLFGFASIAVHQWNLDRDEQLLALEMALASDQMVGIKLAHAHQQFRFDDQRFYPIYEIAGRLGKPLYLHTATSPNPGTRLEPPYTDPYYLEEAIRSFPDTVFVLGHAGWDSYHRKLTYTDACIDLATRYPNVYMEPGALGATRAEEVLPDFVRRIQSAGVTDKLIYGSDGPQFPGYAGRHLENFVAAMRDADYTKSEMTAVLAGNFRRVFEIGETQ